MTERAREVIREAFRQMGYDDRGESDAKTDLILSALAQHGIKPLPRDPTDKVLSYIQAVTLIDWAGRPEGGMQVRELSAVNLYDAIWDAA